MSWGDANTDYSINSTSDTNWAAAVTQLHVNISKPVYYTHGSMQHKHSNSWGEEHMRYNSGGVQESYNTSQTLNYFVPQSSWHFWNFFLDNTKWKYITMLL
jgi:hypothetical protein